MTLRHSRLLLRLRWTAGLHARRPSNRVSPAPTLGVIHVTERHQSRRRNNSLTSSLGPLLVLPCSLVLLVTRLAVSWGDISGAASWLVWPAVVDQGKVSFLNRRRLILNLEDGWKRRIK